MRLILKAAAAAAATIMLTATAASAAVTFDPGTGTGFVGKGDVQTALGLNNNAVQNTAVSFSYQGVTAQSWSCVKTVVTGNGEENVITQERAVTTSTTGVVSSVERVRNQITGYHLEGFSGTPTVVTSGPAAGSCPNDNSEFVQGSLGDPEVISGGLRVNGVPLS
ncbi:hypothetical protein [Nocardioides sp.]|uniref:hypothetical protein n=1 Tax=Nocardioides sp. TaxID=35761 RepID=UPI0027377668|nr:hypothetical protein [Nocardioides sp.]MDP3892859.1 hypothetical protein [Nocardioides sp.]